MYFHDYPELLALAPSASIPVALVAINAVVDVTPHPVMVGICLRLGVTVGAGED